MVGRPRKWKDNAEKQRAWRLSQKLKQGKLPPKRVLLQKTEPKPQSLVFRPELQDTTTWGWKKWALYFLGITLTWFQLAVLFLLDHFLRIVINIPRRHGKTKIILKIFILRKMCETAITRKDDNMAYISSDDDNISSMVFGLANLLSTNERIIENYGYLLESAVKLQIDRIQAKYQFRVRRRDEKQTQYIINLTTRKDLDNYSFYATTIRGTMRGKGYHRVFIDDPVDIFDTDSPASLRKLTKKLLNKIRGVILPLAIKNVAVVGTRYDIDGQDIHSILAAEMDGKIWKHVTYKAFNAIGRYEVRETTSQITPADIIVMDRNEWELLSEYIWDLRAVELLDLGIECSGLQLAIYTYHTLIHSDRRFFMQEYQNEPQPISETILYEWFQDYGILPTGKIQWGVFVDVSAGEGKLSDYTGITLVGAQYNNYYVHDMIYGRWTPKVKVKKLEEFVLKAVNELGVDIRHIMLGIETVLNQRDHYQRVRDESFLTPAPVSPAGRGTKESRIIHGLGQEMENSKVFLYLNCRNKSQLRSELSGFPGPDNHLIDSLDQNIFRLKHFAHKTPVSGKTTRDFER